ncbi:hypothetical protein PACILC2_13220 [Paenibacillus cisolokensis]|uniref:Uncharacterized protein n=2 Tax=Paenibacillus cisolokensis TaxID=1658519 RepID=A0ABQ4N3H7_9BACL|nr:hypothetical protein PACILC2_13220 [Paenibacillus cisolokensis]
MSDTGVMIMALIFGLLIPALFIFMKAGIVVTKQEVIISLLPIFRKKIALKILKASNRLG